MLVVSISSVRRVVRVVPVGEGVTVVGMSRLEWWCGLALTSDVSNALKRGISHLRVYLPEPLSQ